MKIDPEGWIEWSGGGCPISSDTYIEVKTRGGVTYKGKSDECYWYHLKHASDVIAYRVVSLPPKSNDTQTDDAHSKYGATVVLDESWFALPIPPGDVQPIIVTSKLHSADNPNDIQTGGTHYKDMGIEPWDVIDTWPSEQQIGYHRGNILKYTMRMGSKDERLKEAKKIAHYAQKLVSVLEKEND